MHLWYSTKYNLNIIKWTVLSLYLTLSVSIDIDKAIEIYLVAYTINTNNNINIINQEKLGILQELLWKLLQGQYALL